MFDHVSCEHKANDSSWKRIILGPRVEPKLQGSRCIICRAIFARQLKALPWRTPFQGLHEFWTKDPSSFKINLEHFIPGPHTQADPDLLTRKAANKGTYDTCRNRHRPCTRALSRAARTS